MFGYDKLFLNLAYDKLYLFLLLILIVIYSIYVYRFTVPPISKLKKLFLTLLRATALFILLFIFFEPIFTLTNKTSIEPKHLVFIDNSRSLQIDDGTNRTETVKNIVKNFQGSAITKEFNLFGNEVRIAEDQNVSELKFDDGNTNISSIFSSTDISEEFIASITIITDGVITDGSDPVYSAEKLKIPVFTIGVGDTSHRNDIELRRVQYNEIIYTGTPVSILATILSKGFHGKSIRAELIENNILQEQKTILLSSDGIQNEVFTYTPSSSGEKKLQLKISGLEGEVSYANNIKVFYVNVLSNKIKVTLLAGSPSSDLSFIKNSLTQDENLSVSSVTQISQGKILESNFLKSIDSADVFFLIGFPSNNLPQEAMNLVRKKIVDDKKPFFICSAPGFNWNNLSSIQSEIPVLTRPNIQGNREIQPEILSTQINNPLFQHNSQNPIQNWNSLPPIRQDKAQYLVKPESRTISNIKVNNTIFNEPLIVTRNLGGRRSIAVLGYDLWRWKLQASTKKIDLFDNFIINSVKWLYISETQKQVTIKPSKKNYSTGEPVEFTAQVYDESFNPINNAEVRVRLRSEKSDLEIDLTGVGNGLYEGILNLTETGDFYFDGEAVQDGSLLGKNKGTFNVGELDIEMINPRLNYELLMQLSNRTGGKYFSAADHENIFPELEKISEESVREKIINSEISLWSNEWMLIIPILLFAIEWFIRKREGML